MKKVLVVDDSEVVRRQIRSVLNQAGYDVVEAIDGVDGLDKLRTNQDLAVVLCDVNMPRLSGLEMLTQAKQQGFTTKIIMLTTEGQPALVRQARDAGAKGWIVKPFKNELLLAAVEKVATTVEKVATK